MYRACIAIVDASRARLFTFERSNEVEGVKEKLIETRDLIDPARRLSQFELLSDSRTSTNRAGNLQYGIDDHRDAKLDALDAAFAREIMQELREMLRSSNIARVIFCASPPMLGQLRRARTGLDDAIAIDEVPRNLTQLTANEVRERLASYGVLPPQPARLPA